MQGHAPRMAGLNTLLFCWCQVLKVLISLNHANASCNYGACRQYTEAFQKSRQVWDVEFGICTFACSEVTAWHTERHGSSVIRKTLTPLLPLNIIFRHVCLMEIIHLANSLQCIFYCAYYKTINKLSMTLGFVV